MARTTAAILAQLERFLPPRYAAYRDVLAGGAAGLAEADALWEDLADAATIGGADGVFLRLRARGFGIQAQGDETDASIRSRIRSVEGQVTRPAILAAVNALLAPYTATEATMLEPWDEGFLDYDCYSDDTRLCDAHNSFVLVLPLVGDQVGGSSYIDDGYIDIDLYVGASGEEHPVYEAIRVLVNRIRAAGIRAWMAIDT
jgi:hypothetical protein